jgi:hypothetical protein
MKDFFTLKDLLPDDISLSDEYQIQDTDKVSQENWDLLDMCRAYWDNLFPIREEYKRNRNFFIGDQWSDSMLDPTTGQTITEEEHILNQGKLALKNNQIQKTVRNIVGQYRDNDYKPTVQSRNREKARTNEMMTNALQYVVEAEELAEVDTRMLESFLLHACPGYKVDWGWNPKLKNKGINIDPLNVHRLFFNSDVEDLRLKDLNLIGEIHDMVAEDIVATFGKGDEEKESVIKRWIGDYSQRRQIDYANYFGSTNLDSMSFYITEDESKIRIFEIWHKKKKLQAMCHDWETGQDFIHELDPEEAKIAIDSVNQDRLAFAQEMGIPLEEMPLIDIEFQEVDVWHYKFLTAQGHCLAKGETPFTHNEHPYILRPYPMMDRILMPFVSTIIDQQKYINRLILMMDFMLGAGAKGVLMVPEDAIPKGMKLEDFSDQWVRFNGAIMYKPSKEHNHVPRQVYSQSQSVGAEKMLALQLQLFKEIGGVNDAIQGQKVAGVNTASQYAQMANNASISIKDYFEHFANVRKLRDKKIVDLIQQYWDKPRFIAVSGADYESEAYMYNPDEAQGGEYDIVIGRSGNGPVYRAQMDDYLWQMLNAQMIPLDTFLEHTSLPFAQSLAQSLKEKQEQQLAQVQGAISGDPQAQQVMANPDNQAFLQQLGLN